MILRDISFDSPNKNILFDDLLLQLAEDGKSGEVLRFWESPSYFVVLGRICKVKEDVNTNHVKEDKINVLRRSSGGGTVLQGVGCLNYSLILSKELRPEIADLRKSYEYLLSRITKALNNINIGCEFLPISDIAIKSSKKKISGNAQRRRRSYILHHGTLLYNFDLGKISRYLRMPLSMPEYRLDRAHSDFVENLNVSVDVLKKEIKKVFPFSGEKNQLDEFEEQLLNDLDQQRRVVVQIE